jgi:hypothetical protein
MPLDAPLYVPVYSQVTDILLLSSDLLTGKSIPVLVGITRLPVDQFVAGVVLSMGAVSGALFSFYASHAVRGMHPLGVANRLLQLLFSLVLSLSLHLSLSRGVHYGRGVVLSVVPAFCVVAQSLPQRDSTVYMAFVLAFWAYWYCMLTPVEASEDAQEMQALPRILRGLNSDTPEQEAAGVWDVVLRALQLFGLAFYACIQHAPTQVYINVEKDRGTVYASGYHAKQPSYALFVGLASALIRVSVWYGVCFFQNNALHVMLENDLSRGGWDWVCCILYSTTLLFSACWTATQIREQVLPFFKHFPTTPPLRLKLVVCALSLAVLYRQRDAQAMFYATFGLLLASLLVTAATLRDQ